MVYRTPGSYVRFIKNVKPKDTTETTRIMGLVGTGADYYEIYNEVIRRNPDTCYDILTHENVEEIFSVSLKPILTTKGTAGNTVYQQGQHFNLKQKSLDNGNSVSYIVWNALPEHGASVMIENESISADVFNTFKDKVHYSVNGEKAFLVNDGVYRITITNVSGSTGTFSITNIETLEILNSTVQSNGRNVPEFSELGINFSMDTTLMNDSEGNPLTHVGESFLVKTKAPATQINATVAVDTESPNTNLDWANLIAPSLKIVNQSDVQTAVYELVLQNVEAGIFDIKIQGQPTSLFTGTIGLEKEYIGIIPGVSFDLDALYTGALIHDKVVIKTTAAQQGAAPAEDNVYYASYKFKKSEEDYAAKIFYEYEDVVKEYGEYEVSPSTGIVRNSLTLAAEIAFQRGATPIVCIQVKNDTDAGFNEAIDALQRPIPGLRNINTIIPLTSSLLVGQHLKQHVLLMSDYENGKERMAYLSASLRQPISKQKSTFDQSIGMIETAKLFNEERIVYVVPGEAVREIIDLNTGKIYDALLPACFVAVEVAAISLLNDPAEPLTNKVLLGFKSLAQAMLESEKKKLSAAGCLVVEQDNYVIKIRHGVTTATFDPTIVPSVGVDNSAAVEQQEITLIQIKDYVSDLARIATARYIGTKNKATSVSDVTLTMTTLLNQLISNEIILGVENLVVRRSKNDPREIEVSFDIEAVYPLNYITISFGFAV